MVRLSKPRLGCGMTRICVCLTSRYLEHIAAPSAAYNVVTQYKQ